MGGEVTIQIMESWLANVSTTLQTPSPSSSPLLAYNTWKGFVTEDIHGQEGSEDHGPLWPPAWMFTSKGNQAATPMCNQPSWAHLDAEFAHSLGLWDTRLLPGLHLIREPQTTAAIEWCQRELSQHCAGRALCCITSEGCHSSHIHCCTHPIMKEALAACPAAPAFASLPWVKLQSKLC